MRFTRYPVILISVTAIACSGNSAAPPSEPRVGTSTERIAVSGPIRDFVPDVPAFSEGGECQTRELPGRGKDIGIAFPDVENAVRQVWLTFGTEGKVVNYSDVRGDLVRKVVGADGGPPRPGEPVRALPPAGRQTSIHLNITNQVALAQNVGGDRPQVTSVGAPRAVMNAKNLGNPAAMIELVLSRCGRP